MESVVFLDSLGVPDAVTVDHQCNKSDGRPKDILVLR